MNRRIPVSVHALVEVLAAPAIMAAPFVLGFAQGAAVVTVALGAILLGHALQLEAPRRTVGLATHARLDYGLAILSIAAGTVLAVGTGQWGPASFLVGIGAAQVMLTASTRFSIPVRV